MTDDKTGPDPIQSAEALYYDVAKLVEEEPANTHLIEAQVHGAYHLISLYARAKELAKAQSLFDQITDAIIRNPDRPGFRDMKGGVQSHSLLHTAMRGSSTKCGRYTMRLRRWQRNFQQSRACESIRRI
jgi:hypothetical protein